MRKTILLAVVLLGSVAAFGQDEELFVKFQLDENTIGLSYLSENIEVGDTLAYGVNGEMVDWRIAEERDFYMGDYFFALSKEQAQEIATSGISALYRNDWEYPLSKVDSKELSLDFVAFAKRYNYSF